MTNIQKIKIACVTSTDPHDRRSWSGVNFNVLAKLEKYVGAVTPLGPYRPENLFQLGRLKNGLYQKLAGKRIDYMHSRAMSLAFGKYFVKKLKEDAFDLIVAPAASSEIANLETNLPIIYITDTTFKASMNYHKALSGLSKSSILESFETERLALVKSRMIVVSSEWARNSVVKDFKIDEMKTVIVPFGANLEVDPGREIAEEKKTGKVVRLLFIGVHWESKGGPVAFSILQKLLERGVAVHLTVCGCVPPDTFRHPEMTVIPFLNKNIPEERQKLEGLFKDADFFILPTKFEAFGMVFSEAAAFGLISLAGNTGGVSGAVREGVNGFLFPPDSDGSDYCDRIMELMSDRKTYSGLAVSARERYERELNWDAWGRSVAKGITRLIPEVSGRLPGSGT